MSFNLEHLKGLKLSPDQIISKDIRRLSEYGTDWLQQWRGLASLILFPQTKDDLIHIVKWARAYNYALIPAGGRTGLSGGTAALKKEVIVSFDKMNQLVEFNPWDRTAAVESGYITQNLQDFAKEKGLYFPISFSAEGSSQIGGNIATNVGGVHVLRYGNIKQYVLGLEVVTGKGELLKLGRALVKNAVGYPLKELFIGSEGTLGLIAEATLSLVLAPEKPQVFLIGIEKSEKMLDIYKSFQEKMDISAFEFFTDLAMSYVLKHGKLNFPLSNRTPFYLLIELEEKNSEKAFSLFESFYKKNWVKDGVLSQSSTQASEIWKLRENISESISFKKPYKNDVSVRVSRMPDFFKDLDKILSDHYPDFESIVFGHLGDGNLHINILKPEKWKKEDFIRECEKVNLILFELIQKYEGSISAEHGIGLLKKDYLSYSCSPEEIALMKDLKKCFDPDNILNPGKIFDL